MRMSFSFLIVNYFQYFIENVIEAALWLMLNIRVVAVKTLVSQLFDHKRVISKKKKKESGNHFAATVDVSNSESVQKLIAKIKQDYPTPEILVNCAGITRDSLMLSMSESMFDDVIKVNLKGTYLMIQAISNLMIERKVESGSIINISSVSGKIGNFGQCNYAASKMGVEGLTKTTARELAMYNIRCNAVMPGFIDTPMVQSVPDKVIEKIKKEIPLRRLGKPEEIAETCVFLASRRSSYITGSIIQVSGGLFM